MLLLLHGTLARREKAVATAGCSVPSIGGALERLLRHRRAGVLTRRESRTHAYTHALTNRENTACCSLLHTTPPVTPATTYRGRKKRSESARLSLLRESYIFLRIRSAAPYHCVACAPPVTPFFISRRRRRIRLL